MYADQPPRFPELDPDGIAVRDAMQTLPYAPPSGQVPREGYAVGGPALDPAAEALRHSQDVAYQDTDFAAMEAWVQEVVARGHDADVQRGLEIDPRTGKVVGQMPGFYPVQ